MRTGTSSPAVADPAKFTVVFRRVRPRSSEGSVRLVPSTSTSSTRPTRCGVPLGRHALDDVDEALDALVLDLVRHLIRHRRGLGAAPRRVDERKGAVEADLFDGAARLFEVTLGLAGEADDEVGGEREVGDCRSELADEAEVALPAVRATHPLEDPRGAGLKWQMRVFADGVALGHRGDDGCAEVLRVRAREADALDAVDVVHRAQELAELRADVGQQVSPPRVDVLAEQRDLADALAGERGDLRENLARPAAHLSSTNGRHDAVRADGVAAHGDLHPCLERAFPLRREGGREAALARRAERRPGDP